METFQSIARGVFTTSGLLSPSNQSVTPGLHGVICTVSAHVGTGVSHPGTQPDIFFVRDLATTGSEGSACAGFGHCGTYSPGRDSAKTGLNRVICARSGYYGDTLKKDTRYLVFRCTVRGCNIMSRPYCSTALLLYCSAAAAAFGDHDGGVWVCWDFFFQEKKQKNRDTGIENPEPDACKYEIRTRTYPVIVPPAAGCDYHLRVRGK